MEEPRYAEDSPYWVTAVNPAKSQGSILALLDDFGVTNTLSAQGQVEGRTAWMIRFEWRERTYRFTFTPLYCQEPLKISSFGGVRRPHLKQAEYQMGRIAMYFVKAILTAADTNPHALFGFVELPAAAMYGSGLPVTAGDLDVSGMTTLLPEMEIGQGARFLIAEARNSETA